MGKGDKESCGGCCGLVWVGGGGVVWGGVGGAVGVKFKKTEEPILRLTGPEVRVRGSGGKVVISTIRSAFPRGPGTQPTRRRPGVQKNRVHFPRGEN